MSRPIRLLTTIALLLALGLALSRGAAASGEPPVPDAGGDLVMNEDTPSWFNGTATDPESDVLTLGWLLPGPVVLVGAEVQYAMPEPGTWTATFWANDGTANETDSVSVEVLDITPPTPVIYGAASLVVDEDSPAALDGTGSFDNVGIVAFLWTVYDVDTSHEYTTGATTYTWSEPGTYLVSLAATDDAGNVGTVSAWVSVLDITAPVATITLETPVDEDTLQVLDGTLSTDNVGVVSFEWTIGDAAGLTVKVGAMTTYTWWQPGTYEVTLEVADAAGNLGSKSLTVAVRDTTAPQAALVVPASFNEDLPQTLDASASTDNVGVASFVWTIGTAGGPETVTGEIVTFTWATPGTFTVVLTVADAAGNADSEQATVVVNDATPPQAAFAAADRFPIGSAQTLDGSGSSDNVGIVSYAWTFEDGGSQVVLAGASVSYTWETPGSYTVWLVVADAAGLTGAASLGVEALEITPPVAVITLPLTVDEDAPTALDGSGSNDNVGVVSWLWTIFDDGFSAQRTGSIASYTFAAPGAFVVELTVADAAGNTNTASRDITVADVTPPTPAFELPSSAGNDAVAVDGSLSTDNVGIVSFNWTFEDVSGNATATGALASHTWAVPGTFEVRLEATDLAGNVGTLTRSIEVFDTTAPAANAGPDLAVSEDTPAAFTAAASTDNDPGFPTGAHFTWTFVDGVFVSLTGATAVHTFSTPGNYAVELTATDAAGNVGRDRLTVAVLDTTPPVAAIRLPARVPEDVSQTLDARLSTDNVAVAEWLWTVQFSAGTVPLSGETVEFTWVTPGLYTVVLEVRDAAGNTGTAAVEVTVLDLTPPVAAAGGDLTVSEDEAATFDAGPSSDNSLDFATTGRFVWSFSDGGLLRALDGPLVLYTFATPGVFAVTLVAADASGNIATDLILVHVLDVTLPLAAAVGGATQSTPEDTAVLLDATPSTDNDPLFPAGGTFTWTVQGPTLTTLVGRVVTFVFDDPGAFIVELRVLDGAGNAALLPITFTVVDTTAPVARISPTPSADEDVPVDFDGGLSQDNAGVVEWSWTFEDTGGQAEASGPTASYTWATPGLFAVTLRVLDAAGLFSEASAVILVADTTAPEGAVSWPQEVSESDRAEFSAAAVSDNDPAFASTRTDAWAFVDHGVAFDLAGPNVSHIFTQAGTYTVVLTVADGAGNTFASSFDVVVADITAPWLVVTSPLNDAVVDSKSVLVTGTYEQGATLSINGSSVGNIGWFAERLTLSEGVNTVTFEVRDGAGNRESTVLRFRVHSEAPVLAVSSPQSGAVTRAASIEVAGVVIDWSGVVLRVAGTGVAVGPGGAFSALVPLVEGANAIYIEAVDEAGHVTSATLAVTRDTKGPVLSADLPGAAGSGDAFSTAAGSVELAGQTEPGSTLVVCKAAPGGQPACSAIAVAADGTFRTALALPPLATTNYTVTSSDAAGNTAAVTFAVAQVQAAAGGGFEGWLWGSGIAAVAALTGAASVMMLRRGRGGRPEGAAHGVNERAEE